MQSTSPGSLQLFRVQTEATMVARRAGPARASLPLPAFTGNQWPFALEVTQGRRPVPADLAVAPDGYGPWNQCLSLTLLCPQSGAVGPIRAKTWVVVARPSRPGGEALPPLPGEEQAGLLRDWQAPTAAVQAEHSEIVALGERLRLLGQPAEDIEATVARFLRTEVRLGLAPSRLNDAVTCLREGGHCMAVPNLAAALFRAAGVPARLVAVEMPFGHVTEMHGLLDYRLPDGRWRRMWNWPFPCRRGQEVVMKVAVRGEEEDRGARHLVCYARPFWDEDPALNAGRLQDRTRLVGAWPAALPEVAAVAELAAELWSRCRGEVIWGRRSRLSPQQAGRLASAEGLLAALRRLAEE